MYIPGGCHLRKILRGLLSALRVMHHEAKRRFETMVGLISAKYMGDRKNGRKRTRRAVSLTGRSTVETMD